MKVTNWRKKLAAALVAAGMMAPSAAYAATITVPDADFKTYTVPSRGFAYATGSFGAYRPPGSPWVDDLGHSAGNYIQDNNRSSWLYNSTYASASSIYPFPHGGAGDQVMQGGVPSGHYSGQVLSDVFQADTTYTFSLWGQGDSNAVVGSGHTNRIYMYLFNGDSLSTFSEAGASAKAFFSGGAALGPTVHFLLRGANGSGDAASQANWTQLSISHTVLAGSPLIGQHIGVGFFLEKGVAVDDASLTAEAAVPEPTTVTLLGLGGVALVGCRRRRE